MHHTSRLRTSFLAMAALALAGTCAAAGPTAPALSEAARLAVDRLVQTQSRGLPGEISVRLLGAAAHLPPCEAPEAFLAPGSELRGRLSIGLRCAAPTAWTRFVQAYVSVQGRYYVANEAIEAGQALGEGNVGERRGDLAALPRSVVTEPSALNGVVAANRIAAGAPLRKELLRGTVVIQQGQTVKVVASGAGFAVSTEARAMTRAEIGATVRAKTLDGRLVTGIADEEGQIRLVN